jgi:hypothetical protein
MKKQLLFTALLILNFSLFANDLSEYQETKQPINPEEISIIVSAFWVLFGWVTRLIEKRKIKRNLRQQLKNSATNKNVSITDTIFENTISKI